MSDVVIVATGISNLASVLAAFQRLGASVEVSQDPVRVQEARRVVLPGVGHFDAAVADLKKAGLWEPLQNRFAKGLPTLAVCLGMQLLLEGSQESAQGQEGLGVIPGRAVRFGDGLRVPHMGWNTINAASTCRYLKTGPVYFANSYRLPSLQPPQFQVAKCFYGEDFVAAIEYKGVLACQFHPELSGHLGHDILNDWFLKSVSHEVQTLIHHNNTLGLGVKCS